MNRMFVFGAALIASSLLIGCNNANTDHDTVNYHSSDEMREQSIELQAARKLTNPGKIYVKDDMILINEMGKGIHMVYNENPADPKKNWFYQNSWKH